MVVHLLLDQHLRGRVLAGECVVMVMLLMLAGFADSEQMRYSEHKKAESKYLVMDPSANFSKAKVCVCERERKEREREEREKLKEECVSV